MNVLYQKSASELPIAPRRRLHWAIGLLFLGLLLWAVAAPPAFALSQHLVAKADMRAVNVSANLAVGPGCVNLVDGGDFEQFNPSWQVVASARPPMYTNERTFDSSAQSLRIGNGLELPNVAVASEARHRPILLSPGATSIILRFRYYTLHEGVPDVDAQQFSLFDATTDQLIYTFLNIRENATEWKLANFDLTAYAGRSVSLRFRVDNDGGSGRTLMYIDNVELEYCAPAPLPTFTVTSPPLPSATPSSTGLATLAATSLPFTPVTVVPATPLPPEDLNCPNILVNGNFESFDGWHFGEDPVPPLYINNFLQEGTRAVLLGNPPENPTNVVTFSSIRQLVTLPFTTGQIQLRWWRLLHTAQTGMPTALTDRQDLILLSPGLQPIQILRRELRNDSNWQEDVVDLTNYRGQTLYIYFNAFNDANNARTWMYLDNVRLRVCGMPDSAVNSSAAIAPTPVAIPLIPTATYTPLSMPTPSPLPSVTATATVILLSPIITETVAAAFAPMPLLTEMPTLPTDPTITVDVLPTPTVTVAASPTLAPIPVANTRPVWLDRLGAVAVLVSILVLIGFIVLGIVRMFRSPP